MTVTTPELSPQAKRDEAATLDERAEQLRTEARALACRAAALRHEARNDEETITRLREEPLRALNGHAEVAAVVLAAVREQDGPVKFSEITERVAQELDDPPSDATIRTALRKLIEGEWVAQIGLKRGSRYVAREGNEDPDAPKPVGQRYHEVVRNEARRLGTFTFAEIFAAFDGQLAEVTIRRWINQLVDDGVVEATRVGSAKLYAYVPPEESAPTHRPRSDPKPWVIPEGSLKVHRGGEVAGTGKSHIGPHKAVNELAREARKHGVRVETADGGHLRWITPDGTVVRSSKTPSRDSMVITRKHLRNAGVPVHE